jgi:hypothetical protein
MCEDPRGNWPAITESDRACIQGFLEASLFTKDISDTVHTPIIAEAIQRGRECYGSGFFPDILRNIYCQFYSLESFYLTEQRFRKTRDIPRTINRIIVRYLK